MADTTLCSMLKCIVLNAKCLSDFNLYKFFIYVVEVHNYCDTFVRKRKVTLKADYFTDLL
jgi:hypothetical protein